MPVHYTENPSAELGVVGAPIRMFADGSMAPQILICQAAGPGQRPCGKVWTASSAKQYAEKAAERRKHEETCKGGLIAATGMGDLHG
jgi:hypothetical protein